MYQDVFNEHAELLKAMSHPKRLEIIHLLRDQELPVGEMQAMLDLPQANLSQHLTVLRDAGVLFCRRDGKQILYKLAHDNFVKASDLVRKILIMRHKNDANANDYCFAMSELVPLVSDPVCGMRLSPKTAGFSHKHKGEVKYFCASGCLEKFVKNPSKYD
ncbi:ArsR family transcriptional regulator [Candidatus Microgenomates bacterium]|nr:MAG: ArsR family transcriptional regulator [Candidatus Microgenomates bacterium]